MADKGRGRCRSFKDPAAAASTLDPKLGVGSCIWDRETRDRQECRFWRAFEIPTGAKVKQARLRITADNFYNVFLDGQQIGQGADWRVLIEYDLSLLLVPGVHVLAVAAFNDFDVAGFVMGLQIQLEDGTVIEVASDPSWKIAPNGDGDSDWVKWTRKSERWPSAEVRESLRWESPPRIYRAPRSKPLVVPFWEKGWFKIGVVSLCLSAMMFCLFLISRLLIHSQLQAVVRRERARIAADLHDDFGGGLTQLVLLGETTRKDLPADSPTGKRLKQICDQSRSLVRDMNETVWLINSQRDTIKDFASYINKYTESFFQPVPVRCRFDIENDLPKLTCDIGVRRNLFLAVKEALNNVLKHSGATEVLLRIHRTRNEIVVIISDNGRGFDPSDADPDTNGLRNMRLRAIDAGGHFRIDSKPGSGCTVEFRVPLAFTKRKSFNWLPLGNGGTRAASV